MVRLSFFRRGLAFLFLCVFFPLSQTVWGEDVLVVTRSIFQDALHDWIDYRQSQGWTVHLLIAEKPSSPDDPMTPEEIRDKIVSLVSEHPITAVYIVGDGAPLVSDQGKSDQMEKRKIIPAPRVQSEVIQDFGEENHIASDAWYADIDNDALPDLAIGRLPARTTADVLNATKKVIRYETETPSGAWQREVSFITGIGGFSPIIDTVIQRMVRQLLSELLPGGVNVTWTQADWKTVNCPDPMMFRYTILDQINNGPLFWVYIGHGYYDALDTLQTPAGRFQIMEIGDAEAVDVRVAAPILLFFACYTGAYDAAEPSVAEALILRPNGPVGVIAGSRTTMPYAMGILGTELLSQSYGVDPSTPPTLGNILLNVKRRLALPPPDPENYDKTDPIVSIRVRLDAAAKMFDPALKNLDGELRDHIHIFNLFGDPLLQVRFPQTVEIHAPETVNCGTSVTVSSDSIPFDGPVRVELAYPLGRHPISPEIRKEFSIDDASRIEYQETYEKANQRVISRVDTTSVNGHFSVEIPVPPEFAGEYLIRLLASDGQKTCIGAKSIHIHWKAPILPRPDRSLKRTKDGRLIPIHRPQQVQKP